MHNKKRVLISIRFLCSVYYLCLSVSLYRKEHSAFFRNVW